MTHQQITLIFVCAGAFGLMALIVYLSTSYNLNRIKSKTIGDGQHGTARWATKREIRRTYRRVEYTPEEWRKGGCGTRVSLPRRIWRGIRKFPRRTGIPLPPSTGIAPPRAGQPGHTTEPGARHASAGTAPPHLPQGIIMGSVRRFGKTYALVDTGDVHVLMIGAAGIGKTACYLYPNLEYCCACGMSFLSTDSKGVRPDRVQ
jgi:type IV secretion system protein VirD4